MVIYGYISFIYTYIVCTTTYRTLFPWFWFPLQVGFFTSCTASGALGALATALQSDDVELRGCGAWALWKAWEVMDEDEMPQRAVEVGWDGGITIFEKI